MNQYTQQGPRAYGPVAPNQAQSYHQAQGTNVMNQPNGYRPLPQQMSFGPAAAPTQFAASNQHAPAQGATPGVAPAAMAALAAPVLNPVPATLPAAPQGVAPAVTLCTKEEALAHSVAPVDLPDVPAPVVGETLKGNRVTMRANTSPCCAWPDTREGLWDLAEQLKDSHFVPSCIRTKTADVFLVLAKAQTLGLSFVDAFSSIYVLPNSKTGDCKMGLYVKTKEGVCKPYGKWTVKVDPNTGDTEARGTRHDTNEEQVVIYSAYEACMRGTLKVDGPGRIVGLGNWAGKWMDMMRARAKGRLLDALFPDIVGGYVTLEEFDDETYYQELQRRKARDSAQDAQAQPVSDLPQDGAAGADERAQVAQAVSEEGAKAALAKATAKARRTRKSAEHNPVLSPVPELQAVAPVASEPQQVQSTQAPVYESTAGITVDNPDAVLEQNPLA